MITKGRPPSMDYTIFVPQVLELLKRGLTQGQITQRLGLSASQMATAMKKIRERN